MSVRLANNAGRASVLLADRLADVERASNGRFGSDPMAAIQRWDEFASWASGLRPGDATGALDETRLGPPIPRPAKVFGVGMNYREHAKEAGMEIPASPVIFTKFPNCLVGPRADVELSSDFVDWEVELVVAIGKRGRRIGEARAFDHVAGYCVGQDISDRKLQFADKPPQFSIGKSIDTFGPIGPALVSIDTFRNPNDLALSCDVAGERMQDARTSDLIFSVAQLIAFLSSLCTLEAGDLIFTGTPSGVGSTRNPRRYLKPGEEIVSSIEGIGTIINRCVAGPR
ncbi:MAG TPA: fumarylacetoacetate hydrolase family protein [Candidatus Kryptonia bacterium]|nr:fumarylacetoacetate hydrolase family protein [Candidatus Kryptonia bacterium]